MDGNGRLQRRPGGCGSTAGESYSIMCCRGVAEDDGGAIGSAEVAVEPRRAANKTAERHYVFRIRNRCSAAAPGGAITTMRLDMEDRMLGYLRTQCAFFNTS